MTSNGTIYCGSGVDNFHTRYKNLHGYVSLIVCVLGTIANTLNIIVLSRREIRSPTNAILTGLAVADLAVMLEYIPYSLHDYILYDRLPREQLLSYSWACFIKFHSIFTQVLHTISIWLTVTLAVWRYIAVSYPQKNRMWCGMRTTMITISAAYIVCTLVVVPSLYLISAIAKNLETLDEHGKILASIPLSQFVIDYQNELNQNNMPVTENENATTKTVTTTTTTISPVITTTTTTTIALNNNYYNNSLLLYSTATSSSSSNNNPSNLSMTRNITVYRLYHSELALHNKWLWQTMQLIYSVLIKLIPCIALTILSVRLIAALLEAKRRRKMLTRNAANGLKPMVNGKPVDRPRKNSKSLEKEKQTDRTTRMLLAVLLLFLITEFPQGIMGLLNTIFGNDFYMQCYLKLSDLMDNLALVNSSINFILYCSMSRQFRTTFTMLFLPKCLDKWLPVAQDEDPVGDTDVARRADMVSKVMAGGGGGKAGGGGAGGGGGARQPLTTQVTNV